MLCGSLEGKGVWEWEDTGICVAESLCCVPETITTLLISYNIIQNKNLKNSSLSTALDFPCNSAGKESACNAGDLVSICVLGRSPGEGKATHSNSLI